MAGTPQAQPLVFSSSAELVRVVVSVTDAFGRPISGLRRDDFVIKDGGKKRAVATIAECSQRGGETASDCQADLVLLLDTSRSMNPVLELARDEALAFADSVPETRMRRVVSFESTVKIWPGEGAQLKETLDRILTERRGSGTRLLEAVTQSVELVESDPSPRPILVALTDGEDTEGSLLRRAAMRQWTARELRDDLRHLKGRKPEEIAQQLQRSAVAFYAISFARTLPAGNRQKSAQKALQALAGASGGLVVDGSAENLGPQFAQIRADLSSQYVLGFVPAPSAKGGLLRTLKIEVRGRAARVRHRATYAARGAR